MKVLNSKRTKNQKRKTPPSAASLRYKSNDQHTKNIVKSVMKRSVETKNSVTLFLINNYVQFIPRTTMLQYVVPQGVTQETRIGDVIRLTGVSIKGYVSNIPATAADVYLWVYVLYNRIQPLNNAANLAFSDIYDVHSGSAHTDRIDPDKATIVFGRRIKIPCKKSDGVAVVPVNFYKSMNKIYHYAGDASLFGRDTGLHFVTVADSPDPISNFEVKLYFKDA